MTTDTEPKSSIFLRLYWIILWIFPSMVIVKFIIEKKFGVAMYFLWPLIFFTMVGARYLDIKYYNGSTTEGEPATMKDFKHYCLYALSLIFGISLLPYLILAVS